MLGDLLDAVNSASVLNIGTSTARLHHKTTTNGIKWVGDDTSQHGNDLGENENSNWISLLHVGEHHGLTSIEATEVGSSVGDDTNDRDTETFVKTLWAILASDLLQAINKAGEFTLLAGTDISGESGTGEVEWVDDAEGSGTSSTTGGAVTNEELDWLGLWVVWAEGLFVNVLEGEVQGLGWEVSDDVSQVTSPEGGETLLSVNSLETVTNTGVLLFETTSWGFTSFGSLLGHGVLHLEEELDTLDWSNNSLGDGGGDTSDKEICDKGFFGHYFCLFVCIS